MSVKPILFNTQMVRAILNGQKSVTRRVIKPQPENEPQRISSGSCWAGYWGCYGSDRVFAPPYQPGDILWVRESWNYGYIETKPNKQGNYARFYKEVRDKDASECIKAFSSYHYKADDDSLKVEAGMKWRPSIHMPKQAARIFLRVKEVRAERLKDIFKDPTGPSNQIVREGFAYGSDFIAVWNKTVPIKNLSTLGYDANPWVWVIEFERCDKPKEW